MCVAGVVAVSTEGHDVSESLRHSESLGHSESWDILSPVRHSLSARRHSRIAAENGVLQWDKSSAFAVMCSKHCNVLPTQSGMSMLVVLFLQSQVRLMPQNCVASQLIVMVHLDFFSVH